MKKIILLTLAVLLIVLSVPFFGCNDPELKNWKIEVEGDYAVVKGYKDRNVTKLVIPATYKGVPVKKIGYMAFSVFENLEEVILPESIEEIGGIAFLGCDSLKEIDFVNTKKIGDSAFENCQNLERIVADKVEELGKRVFASCRKLTDISLPKVTVIGAGTFSGCKSLYRFIAPEAKSVPNSAFIGCVKLANLSMLSVLEVGSAAFCDCENLQAVYFPKVKTIGELAFGECPKLERVAVGNDLEFVHERAFVNSPNAQIIQG